MERNKFMNAVKFLVVVLANILQGTLVLPLFLLWKQL